MILIVWQTLALALQVGAVLLALRGNDGIAEVISVGGFAIVFGSALWVLTRPQLTRVARKTAVVCLGITPTVMWQATNPLLFTGFDEQLHMRTLRDIIASHRLFEANPLLGVSPEYPGVHRPARTLQGPSSDPAGHAGDPGGSTQCPPGPDR